MPRYTYGCKVCGREVLLLRPIAERDNPEVGCTCGGELERKNDAPDFNVKGGTPKFHEKGRK